ncbi:hypothetical protein SCB17_003120 [Clostridium perfringens]|nr:hypothetical protein [Clostridium perfringens]
MQLSWKILAEKVGNMCIGLSYVPLRDTVNYIPKEPEGDNLWAEDVPSNEKIPYRCCVRGAEDTTPINTKEGKQLLPTFTVSFNGKIDFSVGDYLEIEGKEMQILHIKPVRDLSGNTLFTKVKV